MDTGGVQLTVACATPATAAAPVGAPGGVAAGVMEADGVEPGLFPIALVAVTTNVYAVPLVNPTTVAAVAPAVVAVILPGEAVTVYPVIEDPPLLIGAVQLMDACALPPTPATPVGGVGTVAAGVTEADAADAGPAPAAFVALTVNV